MDDQDSSLQALPETSQRKQLAQQRDAATRSFREDQRAESRMSGLIGLVIGYALLLFVSFLIFDTIGPDTNDICNDVASGNFTQEECDQARDARALFWTIVVLAGVAVLIIVISVALKELRKTE